MILKLATGIAALALLTAPAVAGDRAPVPQAQAGSDSWDGLVRVKAKHVDKAWLLPGADFRGYTKVMLTPTDVAFRKNWQRDHNRDAMINRVSDADARRILDQAQLGFEKLFVQAYQKAGYQVVTAPGPDVLRLSTAITDLYVEAPDTMDPGITRTYSREAGEATLVVEARDSVSGQLLGRAVDQRETSDMGPYLRNQQSNAFEFEQLFSRWAKVSAEGLDDLKTLSPVDADGALRKN